MTQLPAPQLWSVLFFVMVLMVGISSQIGILLGFLLPIHDSFLQHRISQAKFTGLTCATLAAIGVIFCLRSGLQWVDIFDGYSGTLPLLVIALCEVLVAAYIYGVPKLEKDVLVSCGFEKRSILQPFWNICWKVISPALLTVIVLMAVVSFLLEKFFGWITGQQYCFRRSDNWTAMNSWNSKLVEFTLWPK